MCKQDDASRFVEDSRRRRMGSDIRARVRAAIRGANSSPHRIRIGPNLAGDDRRSIAWLGALRMLTNRVPPPTASLPGRGGPFAVGAVIGLVAGIVGTAGASLAIPFMARSNVKVRIAVAS
jgi:hypothetical protein